MRRWMCWNCLKYYPRSEPFRPQTLCHACHKCRYRDPKKFDQRDPFIMHKNILISMNWIEKSRIRKPSPQVQAFFDKMYKIRRKMKMIFRLPIILSRLQKESAERAYAPGGLGFQYCQQSFNSMTLS